MKRNNRTDSKWKRRPSTHKRLAVVDGIRSTKKAERQFVKLEILNENVV